MQTFSLSHQESSALRTALLGHDADSVSGRCECGQVLDPHNELDREEHLLEIAFRAGEVYAVWSD